MILTEAQQKQTQRLIADKLPDQLKLPYALWSRKAVALMIKERFGVVLPERTMTDYLFRWGFSAQKPMRRALEQQPEQARKWREETYPAIKRRAVAEGAEIHWGDETGLRNDDVRGRSFAKRGKTPVVRVLNKRFGRSIISTITNRGQMRWMVFKGALDAEIFQDFLIRLIKGSKRKVFLILDNLPVHHAKVLRPWLAEHKARIELFFMPGYSPELNPVEVANADLKKNVASAPPPRSDGQLVHNILSHYRSVSKRPKRVMSYFGHPDVRYAA